MDEEAMINATFQEILDIYLASQHRRKVEIITKAFNFARQAHKGVRRQSGEPYIMHPLAVARIVCAEIGLGSTSICAALLHDVVEDTDYTLDDLCEMGFPEEVIAVLALLTHEEGVPYMEYVEKIKENPIARTVKLADLMHNSDKTRLEDQDINAAALKRWEEKYSKALEILR